MYYQLGQNIKFSGLISPNSFSQSEAAKYATHETIGTKPRLQPLGQELQTISINIKFHASFCVPSDQIQLLRNAKENFEILAFLDGNGRFIGDFVINNFTTTTLKTDVRGDIWEADVAVELLEYYDPNNLRETPSGFANSDQSAQIEPTAEHLSDSILVTQEIGVLNNEAVYCDAQLTQAEADATQTDARLESVNLSTNKMSQSVDRLDVACDSDTVVDAAAALKAYLSTARTSITNLKTISQLGSITDTRLALANLQLVFANMRTLSAGTIVLYATRRG